MSNIPCLYFPLFPHTQSSSVEAWEGSLGFKGELFLIYYFQSLGAIIILLSAQGN